MVAERLLDLRSPTVLPSNSPAAVRTMDAAASPAEEYVQSGVKNMRMPGQTVKVGDVIFNIGVVSAAGFVGAVTLAEAKEMVVEKLTKTFGKYQDTGNENSELSDIQQNALDDSPVQPLPEDTSKKPLFEHEDGPDPATASVTDKRTTIEAQLASNSTNTKKIDADKI